MSSKVQDSSTVAGATRVVPHPSGLSGRFEIVLRWVSVAAASVRQGKHGEARRVAPTHIDGDCYAARGVEQECEIIILAKMK